MKCTTCGTEFEGNFCPACGAPANREEFSAQPMGTSSQENGSFGEQNQPSSSFPTVDRFPDMSNEVRVDGFSNTDAGPTADDLYPSPDLDAKPTMQQGDDSYSSPDLDARAPEPDSSYSQQGSQPPVYGQTPVYGQPPAGGAPQPGNPYGTPKKKSNGCLVAALIVGGFLVVLVILAIVIGVMIYNNAKEEKDWVTGSGLTSDYSYSSSSSGPQTVEPAAPVPEGALTEEEISQLYSDPSAFAGRPIVLTGIVFTSPETDEENIYFQMFSDISNYDGNTVVAYADPDFELEEDCYVRVVGTVGEVFEGESMTGAPLKIPTVIASSVEVISYMDAAAPTIKEVMIGQTQTQAGYSVTVDKVEFAKTETRVYVTVINNSKDPFHLYSFNAKLIQNNSQYEETQNYDADYPEIESELLPGATTTGIIVFEPLEQQNFKLYLEGYSDDYSIDFEDYIFDINVE